MYCYKEDAGMIKTARQLKDKVKNVSQSNSTKAQTLIRNYFMERFLERISLSAYRNNFILKGGMLVSSLIGLDTRATMDIDTTIHSIPLQLENATHIIQSISEMEVDDGVHFSIVSVAEIMKEHEYPGIRFLLEAQLENMRQIVKIDLSTGDVITPGAIEYAYKLMFEEREIQILTYNLETVMAEKLETIISRSTANTRMRDFYDIVILYRQHKDHLDVPVLKKAFTNTCYVRHSEKLFPEISTILAELATDAETQHNWTVYKKTNYYVENIAWENVLAVLNELFGFLCD